MTSWPEVCEQGRCGSVLQTCMPNAKSSKAAKDDLCCTICESWFRLEVCPTDVPNTAILNYKEHWSCPKCSDEQI